MWRVCSVGTPVLLIVALVASNPLLAEDDNRTSPSPRLELRTIDDTRVGQGGVPDSSDAVDVDDDGEAEVFSSMQNGEGHPEVFLYDRKGGGQWSRTRIGVVTEHKGEIEWVAVGTPLADDPRLCVAASVQHKKDGLVVFWQTTAKKSPFDPSHWKRGVAKEYAGQGLDFRDLTGDGDEELIYCTQAGNELGVLECRKAPPTRKAAWEDHVIDQGNYRAWWWLDRRYYYLDGDGTANDFFTSTRKYGGTDTGMWKVIQEEAGNLDSYRVEKVYGANSLCFATGYFFSGNRDRKPDIVMVNKSRRIYLLDGRNGYAATKIPFDGGGWNVNRFPVLDRGAKRDGFVLATAKSPSLLWSFRWRNGAYEAWAETGYPGDYGHPMDGKFTVADIDGDGEAECVTPDSAGSDRAKGLAYLEPVTPPKEPAKRFTLGDE